MFNLFGPSNHIRWTIRRDFPEILEIEKNATENPLVEQDLIDILKQRDIIGMVVEHGDKVVAHMIYQIKKQRLLLLRIAVCPSVKRTGVGRAIVEKLISKLTPLRYSKLVVYVPEENLSLQLFFKAVDLKATRIKNNKYVMEYSVETPQINFTNRISQFIED